MKPFHFKQPARWLSVLILATIALAACAPATTPAPAATQPPAATATTAPKPSETVKPSEAAKPTETVKAAEATKPAEVTKPAEATKPAAAAGKVTYKIVPGQSKVTYEVGETFLNQNNRFNLAKGITTQVSGEVYGDKSNPASASIGTIEIDISLFKSDSDRRDSYIRGNGLESTKYPIAKFVPTKIEALPSAYQEGQEVNLKVTGDLTIKTTSLPVTWNVTTKLSGDTLTGTATTELLMSNFKVGPISILGVLNTEDKVKLTFEFVAKP